MLNALTSLLGLRRAQLSLGAPAPASSVIPPGQPSGIIGPPGTKPVLVRVLAINDFHGQLGDSDAQMGAMQLGGAATLAGYLDRERAANPNGTIVVSAGDAIGASPPESSLLDHESSMAVLAAMGVSIATFGNHEFDRGLGELMRLIKGGRKRAATRATKHAGHVKPAGPAWPGSPFPWISANLVDTDTGKRIAPPYIIKEINGVKVAFIGATTANLKKVTLAAGIRNVKVLDPATAINQCVPEIKAQGVRAIVVMIHEGGDPSAAGNEVTGDIVPVVKRLDPEIDAVVSAHSHKEYVARINGKLVTQAMSYAKAFAAIDLLVDKTTGDVLTSQARIVKNDEAGVTPDPVIARMVKSFQAKVAPTTERVISVLPGPVTRKMSAAGENAMGTLIAEAQRTFADADVAFMNPGGIRQDLVQGGPVTWGKLFGVQPFANVVTRMNMTGAQILRVLEQMFPAHGSPVMLQIAGMRVWFDVSRPIGKRITKVLMDTGKELDPKQTYVVAANAFLVGGGDGFTALAKGRNKAAVGTDLAALVAYLASGKPVPTRPIGRLNIAGGTLPEDAH